MFPHLFSVLKPEQKRAFSSSVSLLKQTVSLRKGPHPTLYIPPPGKPTPSTWEAHPPPSLGTMGLNNKSGGGARDKDPCPFGWHVVGQLPRGHRLAPGLSIASFCLYRPRSQPSSCEPGSVAQTPELGPVLQRPWSQPSGKACLV